MKKGDTIKLKRKTEFSCVTLPRGSYTVTWISGGVVEVNNEYYVDLKTLNKKSK